MLARYQRKRAITDPWHIEGLDQSTPFARAIIIPAYDELETLPTTLTSLAKQPRKRLEDTAIIVVVNGKSTDPLAIQQANAQLLAMLKTWRGLPHLGIVDASSSHLQLLPKFGVGLARRIGTDLVLPQLTVDGLVLWLDADTLVAPNYLDQIDAHFANPTHDAAVVGFRHLQGSTPAIETAIRVYETFLTSTAQRLAECGSPYAYPALGSTIVTRVSAYVRAGGIPRRNAAEDFYFLQAVAKFTTINRIADILVFPAARISQRVHLGTGKRLLDAQNGADLSQLFYTDSAFEKLRTVLTACRGAYDMPLDNLLSELDPLDIRQILIGEGIAKIWNGMQRSAPDAARFSKQFDRWFDALKTLRFLKKLSE